MSAHTHAHTLRPHHTHVHPLAYYLTHSTHIYTHILFCTHTYIHILTCPHTLSHKQTHTHTPHTPHCTAALKAKMPAVAAGYAACARVGLEAVTALQPLVGWVWLRLVCSSKRN